MRSMSGVGHRLKGAKSSLSKADVEQSVCDSCGEDCLTR